MIPMVGADAVDSAGDAPRYGRRMDAGKVLGSTVSKEELLESISTFLSPTTSNRRRSLSGHTGRGTSGIPDEVSSPTKSCDFLRLDANLKTHGSQMECLTLAPRLSPVELPQSWQLLIPKGR